MKVFLRSALFIALLICWNRSLAQVPVADFTATPLTGCAPLVVNFTSTSTGNPTSYQWDLGNGVNTVQQNPSTAYTTPGTYTVTLTVSNANGTNTKTVTNYITVIPNPTISITAVDSADCPPFTVQFNNLTNLNAPGAGTYNWSFGDGNVSNTINPTNTYFAPGLYNITLVATNSAGCAATAVIPGMINIYTPPVTSFTATPTSYCGTPAPITFNASTIGWGPYTYSWDFGDGNVGVGVSPTHFYTTSGTYTVTLIVTDGHGCKDTFVRTNYISIGSIAASYTTSPSPACENAPITFTNTSNGGTSYAWDFGDGNTSTLQNPVHVYATPGVYNIKLAIYDGPCGDSVTLPLTVNPGPGTNFAFTPTQPCPAPSLIQFTNFTSGGAVSYAWDFGDGQTSNLTNPSHTYNTNNFFPVRLTATNALGCSKDYFDTVKIYSLDVQIAPPNPSGCVPLTVPFSSSVYWKHPVTQSPQPYPYPVTTYAWDFGDGNISAAATPSHTYASANNLYAAMLTVTTANGCTATGITTVSVGSKPTASFTDYPDTVCVKTPVHFTNTSTGIVPGTTYTWDMGDMNTRGSTDVSYSYNNSGIYNVELIVNNFGCRDTFRVDSAAVVVAPTTRWMESYNCDTPTLVQFYDTLSIFPTSHIWDFGDGQTSTGTNPSHTYSALGVYTVTLITFNSNYGCTDTLSGQVELIDPVLSFTTADTAICKGDSIVFIPSYTHTASFYLWQIDGTNPPWPYPTLNPNPSSGPWGHRFNTQGVYDISIVTYDIHGCKDSAYINDYVLVSKPQALFSATPPVGCEPLTVLFDDTSFHMPGTFAVSHAWNFGNGTATVTTDTTSNAYPTAGLYNVTLVVTDNVGCKDTLVQPNYIEVRKPTAAFVVSDSAACIGQVLTFTNNSTGTSLSSFWDFGDGTTSTANSPNKSYTSTGNFTVKLVVTDASGCKDSLSKLFYISVTKPSAVFTASDTQAICPPLSVTFTNQSLNAVSYAWDFTNGSGAALHSPTTIFSAPGLYPVRLVITDAQGCTDTAFANINVLGYAGGLSYTPRYGCPGLEVSFTSNIFGVPSMLWDFNDGVTMPVTGSGAIKHTYITPGAYLPKLILSDNAGCTNSSQGLDTIKIDDVLAGFTSTPACVNVPMVFTDTSFVYFRPVTSWYWNFNGQATSTDQTPSYTFTAPGVYTITLGATNAHGCTDTVTRTIEVFPLPIVTAEFDTVICSGDPTQLSASGASTYVWSPSTKLSCTNCPNPIATPTSSIRYIVTGTDANGCVNKDSVNIGVRYITISDVGPGGEICEDSIFQLQASGADRYEWSPAETLDNPDIANPIAAPVKTTIYTVRAWEASCLPNTNYVKVIVHPKPDVNAGKDDSTFAGKEIVLTASSSGFVSYQWSPTATLSCTDCSAPIATPRATTEYVVTVTSDKGCKNSDSVTVFIYCHNDQVFVPNTFTPNNDGQNDIFYPRGTGMKSVTSFRIYNRWGELIFERRGFQLNDASAGWDGTYKGAQLSTDIFIYAIDGICDSGEPISWKGDVTLIR